MIRPAVPLTLLTLLGAAHAADKGDNVLKLLTQDKLEQAQEKCDKWGAAQAQEDPGLREACAKAYWSRADMTDTVKAWRAYRETWKGTDWAQVAEVREASAALEATGPLAPEPELLDLAQRYRDTPTAEAFHKLAVKAAIRDADGPQQAAEVARRYPDAPGLDALVERFPTGFLQVQIDGHSVQVTLDPPVALPAAPEVSWVSVRPDGSTEPWDEAARRILQQQGVSPGLIQSWASPEQGPAFPICWIPGQPPGWQAGVQVRVGKSSMVQPVGWDPGCEQDAWPVFITLHDGAATSISIRPDRRIDLVRAHKPQDVRAWTPAPSGVPRLAHHAVLVPSGRNWLGHPLSGGAPFITGQAPGTTAQSLDTSLVSAGVPPGWQLRPAGSEIHVESSKLANMPPALRDWQIAKGDVVVLAPLTQRVLGLSAAQVSAPTAVAPQLSAATPWKRSPDGNIQRVPPDGAHPAGLYQLQDADIEAALGVIAGAGISRDRVQPLDGWKVDLDGDHVHEQVLRLLIDGDGVLAIIDPTDEAPASTIAQARVFLTPMSQVRSDRKVAGTPFTFRLGDFVYLVWTGAEVTGATTRRRFAEIIRKDGDSYTSDSFDL